MKFDKVGTPFEAVEMIRLMRRRTIRFYFSVLALVLTLLLCVGLLDNWPDSTDHPFFKFLNALWGIATKCYMNSFSTLLGILVSFIAARFFFGDTLNESSPVEAGAIRVTQTDHPLDLVREFTARMGKQAGGEIIVSDNWLCALDEEMYPALEAAVVSGVEKGTKFTFVLMHPNSPLAHRRELVVRKVRHGIHKNILDSLQSLQRIYQLLVKRGSFEIEGGEMHVFCADSYLSLSAYVLPNVAYLGFYGAKGSSIIGPQMLLEVPSMLGDMAQQYADAAKRVGLYRQKVESYDQKSLHYGTQVNLADFNADDVSEDSPMSQKLIDDLGELNKQFHNRGYVSIRDIENQVLDSQAIDFYNVISRKGSPARLAAFLQAWPEAVGRRKSKAQLIAHLKELVKILDQK